MRPILSTTPREDDVGFWAVQTRAVNLMDSCRALLKASLEDAEAVLKDHYGPDAVTDRLLVAQVATVAADIRLRRGEVPLSRDFVFGAVYGEDQLPHLVLVPRPRRL